MILLLKKFKAESEEGMDGRAGFRRMFEVEKRLRGFLELLQVRPCRWQRRRKRV